MAKLGPDPAPSFFLLCRHAIVSDVSRGSSHCFCFPLLCILSKELGERMGWGWEIGGRKEKREEKFNTYFAQSTELSDREDEARKTEGEGLYTGLCSPMFTSR